MQLLETVLELQVILSYKSHVLNCNIKNGTFFSVKEFWSWTAWLENQAAIWCLAVRETGISRHQGGPIERPAETHRTNSALYSIEGFIRGP